MRKSHRVSHWLLAATALLVSSAAVAQLAAALPSLQAQPGHTSVSGLSSGAFMTVQYGVAFSSSTIGLGVVAGGPFYCAFSNALIATTTCMTGSPSAALAIASANNLAMFNMIDPPSGIARLKVYVFSGTQDQVVYPSVVQATNDFFVQARVAPQNLRYVNQVPAGHAFIAPSFGNPCSENATPYISHCTLPSAHQGYDQPKEILQHIYGPLQPAATTLSSSVQAFDQTEFLGLTASMASMDSTGYVYIPQACAANASGCAVHVVFHGCKQGQQSVGDDVYSKVGYNRWADTNGLIVLYPQAVTSSVMPMNPNGCWDWWGYTGVNYMTRSGVQLSAVKAMVDRLTGVAASH